MPKALTAKQRIFVQARLKEDDPLSAYEEAGYITNHSDGKPRTYLRMLAGNVLRGQAVSRALLAHSREIAEREEVERVMSRAHVKAHHVRLMKICEANGDLSNATRNLEDIGKMGAMYADTLVIDPVRHQQYTEIEQEQARRIAAVLLAEDEDPALEVIEHPLIEAPMADVLTASVPAQPEAHESSAGATLDALVAAQTPRVDPDSPEQAQGRTGAAKQCPSSTEGQVALLMARIAKGS